MKDLVSEEEEEKKGGGGGGGGIFSLGFSIISCFAVHSINFFYIVRYFEHDLNLPGSRLIDFGSEYLHGICYAFPSGCMHLQKIAVDVAAIWSR